MFEFPETLMWPHMQNATMYLAVLQINNNHSTVSFSLFSKCSPDALPLCSSQFAMYLHRLIFTVLCCCNNTFGYLPLRLIYKNNKKLTFKCCWKLENLCLTGDRIPSIPIRVGHRRLDAGKCWKKQELDVVFGNDV